MPSPPYCLVEEEAEDVVLAEELDDVPRELVRLVDLGRARRDPLARERADELAELALLVGQDVPGHAAILGRGRLLVRDPETGDIEPEPSFVRNEPPSMRKVRPRPSTIRTRKPSIGRCRNGLER